MEITLDVRTQPCSETGVKVTAVYRGHPVPAKKFDFEPNRGRVAGGLLGLQNHSDNGRRFFKEVAINAEEIGGCSSAVQAFKYSKSCNSVWRLDEDE